MLDRHVRLSMSQRALLLSPSLSHLRERQDPTPCSRPIHRQMLLALPSKCIQNLTTFTISAAITLVPATTISHLDYYYRSLTGSPASILVPLKSILNVPARGIHLKQATPLLIIYMMSLPCSKSPNGFSSRSELMSKSFKRPFGPHII